MPERAGGKRIEKIIAFRTAEKLFGLSKNTIPSRDTQSTKFNSLKTQTPSVRLLLSRISVIKPRVASIRKREKEWNACLYALKDNLLNAFSIL